MLRFLRVQHLAVIDRLELEFERGFTVLTGETGAGKSILVGAVGLLVGGRAAAGQGRPRAGPRGKAVRDRRDPVTVIGDESRGELATGAGHRRREGRGE